MIASCAGVFWRARITLLMVLLLASGLASCGGGGGDGEEPPTETWVSETDPVEGATGVSEYVVISVAFDRALAAATVNTDSFYMLDPSGNRLSGCYVDYRDITVVFPIPYVAHEARMRCSALALSTQYTVRLTTAIVSAVGQAMPSDYEWRFTTRTETGVGTWEAMSSSGLSGKMKSVWIGSQMMLWGGTSGALYHPVLNSWTPVSTVNAPSERNDFSMLWTGERVIVWGGMDASNNALDDGGIYDPATDTWLTLPANPLLSARAGHAAVWTGSQMLVWGGYVAGIDPVTSFPYFFARNDGARYTPGTGVWQSISETASPSRRYSHTGVWIGTRMIVWGGYGGETLPSDYEELNDGAMYDPATNTWQGVSMLNAPDDRRFHSAIWTGDRMVVWGGSRTAGPIIHTELLSSGGSYDPATDAWSATSLTNVPDARSHHAAVWTGSEMIVWGGELVVDGFATSVGTGGRYNPSADSWQATSATNAPIPSLSALPPGAVWSGSKMLVWAGGIMGSAVGGLYTP